MVVVLIKKYIIFLMQPRWEHFEHKGDVGIRGYGRTPDEAFEMAAVAMTAVITNPERIQPNQEIEISCDGSDLDILFLDFLNTIISEMDLRKMLFSKFKVQIDGLSLKAKCYGEKIDIKRHEPAVEVKAATLCELKVYQLPDSTWVAQCVLDV